MRVASICFINEIGLLVVFCSFHRAVEGFSGHHVHKGSKQTSPKHDYIGENGDDKDQETNRPKGKEKNRKKKPEEKEKQKKGKGKNTNKWWKNMPHHIFHFNCSFTLTHNHIARYYRPERYSKRSTKPVASYSRSSPT